LYIGADRRVMAVNYTGAGDSFIPGKPRTWSEARLLNIGPLSAWDLAPDGKRAAGMLEERGGPPKPPTHLTFLLNFGDELQRRIL